MLRNNRVGQGLPLNTIIIAALGIIVLVIIVIMVQKYGAGKLSSGVKDVTEQNCPADQIKSLGQCDNIIYASFKNVGPGQVCCQKEG